MSRLKSRSKTNTTSLADNPLEGEQLLLEAMFGTTRRAPRRPQPAQREQEAPPRPKHYKIVSISLYTEDIERLDKMVRELKRRGHYKANKSQLIRFALSKVNLDDVPKV